MEKFWNIIHFFAYTFLNKASVALDKISPFTLILKIPAVKKLIIKRGGSVEMINEAASNFTTNPILSINIWYAYFVMVSIPFVFCLALQFYYIAFIAKPKNIETVLLLLVVYIVFSSVINYFLLLHKDKYLKYFKKFKKQPHEWKVKWAWISAGVILFPFLLLISSFIAMG